MESRTVKNLLTYWKLFGTSEVKTPKGAETLIEDTIQALEEYKEILLKKEGKHGLSGMDQG